MVYMKKQIITGILITACVALCAAVWPRSTEVEELPAEPVKTAINAEIEARSEETPEILLSAVTLARKPEPVVENEPTETEITTEEKTETVLPVEPMSRAISKSSPVSSEPKPGTIAVIGGVKSIWVPGFGWIKDEGGGSVAIPVYGEGDIDKQVGVMGGGTMVGNPDDELTGNKVGIMGNGTVAEDMYENGHKIGIMGGEKSAPNNSSHQPSAESEPMGEVIYTELQPPVTKDSTPPPYKPNGEPTNQ
jgi:hypothetical protein